MVAVTARDARGCPSTPEPIHDAQNWADPSAFVREGADGLAHLDLLVRGARCAGCIAKIEGAMRARPGMRSARLNLSTGRLSLTWSDGALVPADLVKGLADLGFGASPYDPTAGDDARAAEARRLLKAMAVAGFAAANVMLLSIAVWSGHGEMGPAMRTALHWVSAAIALPAVAYAGRPFFMSALTALKGGHVNMDVPISLAVVLACGLSIYETVQGGRDAYFDAAVMLLFFLLIGRYLDQRLRAKAGEAARALAAMQATTANRVEADGAVVAVAAQAVAPGDLLVLAAGERAPVDGEVVDGVSELDASLATGETRPQAVRPGDRVLSGAVNLARPLTMRATARASDSFLAEIARLVEAGAQSRSRHVRLADRAAKLYVPLVHSLALATLLGWLAMGASLHDALTWSIAVLIITCPCALGLAVPAVQVTATGRLYRAGVLIKSGDALERLADVDHAVFDKTGTLTTGRPTLAGAETVTDQDLERAAMLARASRHPLARALAEAAGRGPAAENVSEHPGEGVSGVIEGHPARFGSAAFVGARSHGATEAEAWFALEGAVPVRFAFAETLRPDAAVTVRDLERRGIQIELLSGDRPEAAQAVAARTGIARAVGAATPREKIARLDALKAEGRRALMVGDGLNDGPALAAAHVSVSPSEGADVAQAAADIVIQGMSLAPLGLSLDVAKKARRRALENFGLAALYNMIAAPLAMFGYVDPLVAAVAMSASSIVVTLNALRLARS